MDLATANWDSNSVSVLLGVGKGTFTTAVPYAVGKKPWSVAIGDLNGDGVMDLATSNLDRDTVSILFEVEEFVVAVRQGCKTGRATVRNRRYVA
jgi:FG-GAP-like repeat